MNISDVLRGWTTRVDREWPELVQELPSNVERAQSGEASWVLPYLARELVPALLVDHPGVSTAIETVAPLVDLAVREIERDLPANGPIASSHVRTINAACAIEAAGGAVSSASWATMRGWLPRLDVSRDEEWTTAYWQSGYAALSLAEPGAYRRVAAEPLVSDQVSFTPDRSFEHNQQALLQYLRAATRARARLLDVLAAWQGFLDAFGALRAAQSADAETLFWVGRLVFHDVGGIPINEVARTMSESIAVYAQLSGR